LDGKGLVLLSVLVALNVMKFQLVWVEHLYVLADVCKDGIIITKGVMWLQCCQMSSDSCNNDSIVAVDMDGLGHWDTNGNQPVQCQPLKQN